MELTTQDIAHRLGIQPRQVLAIAKNRDLLHLSRKVGQARLWPTNMPGKLKPGKRGGYRPTKQARAKR